jgi:SAM-dependent methyltransferase
VSPKTRDIRRVAGWVRALRLVDREIVRAYHLHEAVRDELLFAFVPPERRTAVTADGYGDHTEMYATGGRAFDSGLFDWEIASLDLMKVTRGSRVLVGGVGGGRELAGLVERGCLVVAFEPSRPLFEAANDAAQSMPNVRVFEASYEDLVALEARPEGSLLPLLGPHDAIVLGRGSFAHLADEAQQLALLRALRRSSPKAPVLLSFVMRRPNDDWGDSMRVRRVLRAAFDKVGGHTVAPGLRYDSRRGFVYLFTEEEIRDLAARAGYAVLAFGRSPYALRGGRPPAHAVLGPIGAT